MEAENQTQRTTRYYYTAPNRVQAMGKAAYQKRMLGLPEDTDINEMEWVRYGLYRLEVA